MNISVNGELIRLDEAVTVTELLLRLQINPKAVAVERNRAILARDSYDLELLEEGDSLEIIRMVGGG